MCLQMLIHSGVFHFQKKGVLGSVSTEIQLHCHVPKLTEIMHLQLFWSPWSCMQRSLKTFQKLPCAMISRKLQILCKNRKSRGLHRKSRGIVSEALWSFSKIVFIYIYKVPTIPLEMIAPSLCSQGGQTASPLADPSRTQHHSTNRQERRASLHPFSQHELHH